MARAVFLDRDGVINEKLPEGNYVTRWEDFHILPGVAEGIALARQAGFCVIVITNQRCIAKGLMTEAELKQIHQRMSDVLARAGATIDAIYYCPHEKESFCKCRKPSPGMLLEAAWSQGVDITASWIIGDSDTDVRLGKNAGCKTARLLSENGAADEDAGVATATSSPDIITPSLLDAVFQILLWEQFAGAFGKAAVPAFQPTAFNRPTEDSSTAAPEHISG